MLLAINGILGTVAVTSLNEYNFLSSGTILSLYPIRPIPVLLAIFSTSSFELENLNPFIASNLSIVPPVCPKPLPDNLVEAKPSAASIGANTTVTLSPTPPVLCLSTKNLLIFSNFIISPESLIKVVNSKSSFFVISLK